MWTLAGGPFLVNGNPPCPDGQIRPKSPPAFHVYERP